VVDRVEDDELVRWRHSATEGLAVRIEVAPEARVRAYPTWTVRDLAVHVVRVYGNATLALREGQLERPRPKLGVTREDDPATLATAVHDALDAAETALRTRRHEVVWTPVGPRTPAFWARRLLREAVLHRWDAERAGGVAAPVAEELALELIDEFLETDVTHALDAGAHEPADVVAIRSGGRDWRVDLRRGAVAADTAGRAASASISGAPAVVWLWLMRRNEVPGPVVHDADGSARAFTELIAGFTRPTA
jgi:uncharacterized protein (TIGR03083 family)